MTQSEVEAVLDGYEKVQRWARELAGKWSGAGASWVQDVRVGRYSVVFDTEGIVKPSYVMPTKFLWDQTGFDEAATIYRTEHTKRSNSFNGFDSAGKWIGTPTHA